MSKGLIFKCSNNSESECLERQLLGTDVLARDEVLSLEPGDKLFLLNVDSDQLMGVFEAASKGGEKIVPEAWRGRYPYQVRVRSTNQIRSIPSARSVLAGLELDTHQLLEDFEADALAELLLSNGVGRDILIADGRPSVSINELAGRLAKKRRALGRRYQKPTLESTTLWDFPTQSYGITPKGNNKYAGVTPAFIIWNLVKRYTVPGDIVLDPMCGSGTTIDVCKEEGRRAIGFDIVSVRPDIWPNDARNLPIRDESIDMVFIDSPYGDNIKYNDHPMSIGNISAESEEFYDELEKVIKEAHRVLKPGKVLGWLIGDQWVKKRFTPVGFKIYERLVKHFEPVDIVCVVRRNQSSNTSMWHNRARRFNFFLRGFKYLIIVRKSSEAGFNRKQQNVKWAFYQRGRK